MPDTTQTIENDTQNQDSANVQSAELTEAQNAPDTGDNGLDMLLDINVEVTVAVGKTTIPVKRLLQLAPGSVLTLDKSLDSPIELYIKDSKFATGQVVIVDDHFAIKIKEIVGIDPTDETQKD
jgi:flagellar motor switch protein FliN/FliY